MLVCMCIFETIFFLLLPAHRRPVPSQHRGSGIYGYNGYTPIVNAVARGPSIIIRDARPAVNNY